MKRQMGAHLALLVVAALLWAAADVPVAGAHHSSAAFEKGKTVTAALKASDEKTMHPGSRCIPMPAPAFMMAPDLKRITQGTGVIRIDGAFDGAPRHASAGAVRTAWAARPCEAGAALSDP